MSKKKSGCGPSCPKPIIDIIIPIVLVVGGILLILFFTPIWVWAIIFGVGLVFCGIHMLKRWR